MRSTGKSKNVSHGFKVSMVILLFFLTIFNLIDAFHMPDIDIISDRIHLAVALIIVAYLWIQEVRDYHNLLSLNKDLIKSHEQLKQAEMDTITSLIKAEEEKDEYTRGHSERVTKISMAIAEEMNLDSETKNIMERAGILHDIGKIGISDVILNKKEKLTDDEWEIIKSHSRKGDEILEPLKFLSTERKIILHHHERYDGKGYPAGLKGDDIRQEALILAVADAFDAMNSARSYRKPLSKEAIISELEKSSGTQHSPKVVETLFQLLKKRPDLWEKT